MTLKLELTPEIEARLLAQAAGLGLSLDVFVQQVIQDQAERNGTTLLAGELLAEEWTREFDSWIESFPDTQPIPDDCLRRENLYPDRW